MSGTSGAKRRNVRPRKYSTTRYHGKRRPMSSYQSRPGFIHLDGYNQLGMPSGFQHNDQEMSYDPIYGPTQPLQVEYPTLPPRSFEELHIERSYLLNSLQREDHKATELLKQIRN